MLYHRGGARLMFSSRPDTCRREGLRTVSASQNWRFGGGIRRSFADARCHPAITLPHSSSVGASMGVMSRVGRSGAWTTSNSLSVFLSLLLLSRPRSRSLCERLGVRRVALGGCIAIASPENGNRGWGLVLLESGFARVHCMLGHVAVQALFNTNKGQGNQACSLY